jgi:Sec-independent protein translocase protein TatA
MDSILGIGLPELMVILILAGIVMGPHRVRDVARTLGRVTAQLQGISREFARQLNAELDALEGDDVKGAIGDMRSLQREVEALRQELKQVPRSFTNEAKETLRESQAAFKGEKIREDSKTSGQDGQQAEVKEDAGPLPAPSRLPKPIEVEDDPE